MYRFKKGQIVNRSYLIKHMYFPYPNPSATSPCIHVGKGHFSKLMLSAHFLACRYINFKIHQVTINFSNSM